MTCDFRAQSWNPGHPLSAGAPVSSYLQSDLEEPRTSSINQLSTA